MGVPGHTTRDSYFKYDALRDVPYDLVVVYHGINELRANNAPPEMFRSDYSHYGWYVLLNDAGRRTSRQWSLLRETIVWMAVKVRERFGRGIVPTGRPPDDWLQFGSDYKSAASFGDNLTEIVRMAGETDVPVLLMTFAHYLAPGYTEEAFQNRELDYLLHQIPTELWGEPTTVDRGVEAHNAVIQDLAERTDVLFVDQQAAMPVGRRYYNDICHLTLEGSRLFVANMVPVILPLLQGVDGSR